MLLNRKAKIKDVIQIKI